MTDIDPKHERLAELLGRIPKETPGKDFNARFWQKFELAEVKTRSVRS